MATVKQREANQRNAQLSSCPKSQEGKDKVRLNAITHGLRTKVIEVLPYEDRVEFARRLDAWFDDYAPRSESEIHLVRQAALLTWKIERADRHEVARLSQAVVEAVTPCLNDPSIPLSSINDVFVNAADLAAFDSSNDGERLRRYQFGLQRALYRTLDRLGPPRNLDARSPQVSDPAATVDRRSPDRATPNEAASAPPIAAESTIPAARSDSAGEQGADAPRSPDHSAPNKANFDEILQEIRTPNAPNKANLPRDMKRSFVIGKKRPVVDLSDIGPRDAGRTGWLDISIEKR